MDLGLHARGMASPVPDLVAQAGSCRRPGAELHGPSQCAPAASALLEEPEGGSMALKGPVRILHGKEHDRDLGGWRNTRCPFANLGPADLETLGLRSCGTWGGAGSLFKVALRGPGSRSRACAHKKKAKHTQEHVR